MLHKQKYFIYIGSKNEVILSKICGKYEFNCMKKAKKGSRCVVVKLREREGQGVDPGRSLKGHLWMVDGGYPFPDALH